MTGDGRMRAGGRRVARRLWAIIWIVAITALATPADAQPLTNPSTALEDYVARPDDAYRWRVVESDHSGDGYSTHILRMVSQQWRTKAEADPPTWRHWLVVMVPDAIEHRTAALVIAGGSRTSDRPSFDDEELSFGARLAVLSGTVVAVLMQVPEQPITFPDEAWPHKEDELVAYSWNRAIETGDFSWPVYLPMVKASVRAMDTVQDFVSTIADENVRDFVVIGGSKRGAAAWLTAAVDDRVQAVAPMVIDIVRFDLQMEHHLAVYGEYAAAIHDYVDFNLVQRVDTPDGERLRQVIDPWSYRRALDMPKYILNSTGDQFFPPDSSQFYFDRLRGENLLRYVPNSDHSLANSEGALIDAVGGLFGWYLGIIEGLPRPEIAWRERDDGSVVVTSSPPPHAARIWRTRNPDARDFRLETVGESWTRGTLSATSSGRYVVAPREPNSGFKAFFVELVYPSARPGLCQVYSTEVFVTPDERPFEGLEPDMLEDMAGASISGRDGSAPQGILDDALDFVDGFAGSISEDLHEIALEEVAGDGVEGRAVGLCAAESLDEYDDLIELYVRLGTGQSFEEFAGDRLEELRDDARDFADELWTGADDFIDDALDDVDDVADDVIDDVGDGADEVVDEIGDLF